jgi:hypothetical protein
MKTIVSLILLGMPPSRYDLKDAQPNGLNVSQERRALDQNSKTDQEPTEMMLFANGRNFLEKLKKTADDRSIKVFYVLPWVYTKS